MSNKDYVTELSENLNQIYSHLGVEIFQNQQKEALKIIDGYKERYKKIVDLETKLAESEKELQKYKLEELADACADLGMPKLSKAQLWKSIEDHHTRNMVIEKQLEIANKENNELKHQLAESHKTIEELKGERLKFYTDDVRRTQVINGVHFDIDQLLVFSEYFEHEKWVLSNRDKEIEELKQSQNQIAIEKLENLKEIIHNNAVDFEKGIHIIVTELLIGHIDYQVKNLSEERK